jgi:phospholipase C
MTDPIKHVVLLMLENHSFDQMLGCFKEVHPGLEGVDPSAPRSNRDQAGKDVVQKETRERQMLLDPHHEVDHVRDQMKGGNAGFVLDFEASHDGSSPQERDFIMGYYPRGFLPALHALAKDFMICDHWFSSLPGPTWPNRFFALSGTSQGRVNMPGDGTHTVDVKGWFEQDQDTIFDRLTEKGIFWKSYFHDLPQSAVLLHQRKPENAARYFSIDYFFQDARGSEPDFPSFAFIEPDFNGIDESDDHPPHDIMKAQKLIADVYNAIRSNEPLWESTLLVLLYDEHGGFYDHVTPPPAVAPDEHQEEYSFLQLGIRVPAVLVSPWVEAGFNSTVFDHTSVLKYLIEKWGLGTLGERAKAAASIGPLIAGSKRQDTIRWISLTPDELSPPDPEVEETAAGMVSSHHQALATIGDYLKTESVELLPRIYTWFSRLFHPAGRPPAPGGGRALSSVPGRSSLLQAGEGEDVSRKTDFQAFLHGQKLKAVPLLAAKVRDPRASAEARKLAATTLSHMVGRSFHRRADPAAVADRWLKRHGF